MDKVSVQMPNTYKRGTDSFFFQKPKLSQPLKTTLFYKNVLDFCQE